MTIPLLVPLVVVLLFLAVYLFTAGFQMYHVYAFGVWDKMNIGVAAAFLIVTTVLFFVLFYFIFSTDWSQSLATFSFPSFPS